MMYKTVFCGCKQPMVPYAESLNGYQWLEKCEKCNRHILRTHTSIKEIKAKAAEKLAKRWETEANLPVIKKEATP